MFKRIVSGFIVTAAVMGATLFFSIPIIMIEYFQIDRMVVFISFTFITTFVVGFLFSDLIS